MPVTVVFDTNILFSATGWRGHPFRCVELARSGKVRAVTCAELYVTAKDRTKRLDDPDVAVFRKTVIVPEGKELFDLGIITPE